MVNFSSMQFYPLQFDVTAFNRQTNPRDAIFFGVGVGIFVLVLVIVNVIKKKYNPPSMGGRSSSGSGPRHFSGFALHREVSGMGLDRDQIKMLDFVFKNDNVVDPHRSLNSSSLLDRHFLKTYRFIERTAGTDDEAQDKLTLLFSTRNILESNSSSDSISSTRQIPENASAVLGTGRDNYPVKVLSTKGDHLVVENPHNALGTTISIPRGSKVTLSFFTKSSKGFSFESRILGASESAANGPVLQLVHTNQIKKLSQRRFRRRQTVLSSSFYFVHLEETGRHRDGKKMVVDKRRLTGNIMDISIGGCSIKTNVTVPSGTRLKIEASPGGANIAVLGQVLRTNRTGISIIMHIKFLRIPRRSLNLINALVYEYAEE